MLTITGLQNFFFLPRFHDMRCKASTVAEIIRTRYNRDPLNGDVYIFMSRDCKRVRLLNFEEHAYYIHEKSYEDGYAFVKVHLEDDVAVYHIHWKDLVAVLETPVVKTLRLK